MSRTSAIVALLLVLSCGLDVGQSAVTLSTRVRCYEAGWDDVDLANRYDGVKTGKGCGTTKDEALDTVRAGCALLAFLCEPDEFCDEDACKVCLSSIIDEVYRD